MDQHQVLVDQHQGFVDLIQHHILQICLLLCDSQTPRYVIYSLKISATCQFFLLLLLILMSIASTFSQQPAAQRAWTHARAELVRLGVPSEVWPRHEAPDLMYSTYFKLLRSPLDRLHRIAVLLTVQRFEIPSQDLGTV